jgi:hypothetical protein
VVAALQCRRRDGVRRLFGAVAVAVVAYIGLSGLSGLMATRVFFPAPFPVAQQTHLSYFQVWLVWPYRVSWCVCQRMVPHKNRM